MVNVLKSCCNLLSVLGIADEQGGRGGQRQRRRIVREEEPEQAPPPGPGSLKPVHQYQGSNESGYLSTGESELEQRYNAINDSRSRGRGPGQQHSGIVPPSNISSNKRWMLYKISKNQQGGSRQGAEQEPTSPRRGALETGKSLSSRIDSLRDQEAEPMPGGARPDLGIQGTVQSATDKLKGAGQEGEPAAPSKVPSGDLSGLISKAKEGLSQSGRSYQRPVSPPKEPEPQKSESDLHWEQIEKFMCRPLRINDMDFTDLTDADDIDYLAAQMRAHGVPPPPPTMGMQSPFGVPPPPPLIPGVPPPPPPPGGMPPPPPLAGMPPPPPVGGVPSMTPGDFPGKTKKTVRLHWREAKDEFSTPSGRTSDTIWKKMQREIGQVNLDTEKLEHLFETKTSELKTKVCTTG